MLRGLQALLTVAAIAAAVFFWRQTVDLQTRLDGFIAGAQGANATAARLGEIEGEIDGFDRGFSRALNAQDALTRDLAALETTPEQAGRRAALEARLARLRDDLLAPAAVARDLLNRIDLPDFTLDPAEVDETANAAFLAKIDADPAYARTPSGLRWRKLVVNEAGAAPTAQSTVSVTYEGAFVNGVRFDGTRPDGGDLARFPLKNLIEGWVEGLQLAREGETLELVIPYDLAYGIAGRGAIPPRQTLIFRIGLVKVETPAPEAQE